MKKFICTRNFALLLPLALVACSGTTRLSTRDIHGSASSIQGTPLHDQIPAVGYGGKVAVANTIDPFAVPVFTSTSNLDRATTFVSFTIQPVFPSDDGDFDPKPGVSPKRYVLSYGRLGEAGGEFDLDGWSFGVSAHGGMTQQIAVDSVGAITAVKPRRLVDFTVYRVGGQPAEATQISGELPLMAPMDGDTSGRVVEIARMDKDYYRISIRVHAESVAPLNQINHIGGLKPLPYER